jgi:hypothetical protein
LSTAGHECLTEKDPYKVQDGAAPSNLA